MATEVVRQERHGSDGSCRWGSGVMKEFLRGAARLHILHHAAEEEIHGAWMTAELARHGYQISAGTLYPTLHRLQDEGLLTSRHEVVNGKTRRLYRITDAGEAMLAEGRRAVAELAGEVIVSRVGTDLAGSDDDQFKKPRRGHT
ncbi:PadR family transcriptional regulator [Kribbella sp. DT2]|uniref:PadR family transcriptional regulator n=1 Tax=Kribbella sp. DT2 TaxID=3393427 RepID=UPI003CF97774